MPKKHSRKIYLENGYYHVYNRGVNKRKIFKDNQDYLIFLHLLKYYLSPSQENINNAPPNLFGYKLVRPRPLRNLSSEIELLTYCLMPNHFHLLIKQITINGMSKLMQHLLTTYSMYFNKRNNRVGHLFQGRYKAALVDNDSYLLHLSRYIHTNPTHLTGPGPVNLTNYPYSSYTYYLGNKKSDWIKPELILKFFDTKNLLPFLKTYPSYQKFVEESQTDPKNFLGNIIIE